MLAGRTKSFFPRVNSMMIERFVGKDGRHFLIEALRNQPIFLGESCVVEAVCDGANVLAFKPEETIIEESSPSNDIYFILSGIVSIRVHGREIAVRTSGQHVGEMTILDPGQRRSASAVAEDEVVVARVDAATFSKIADSLPLLWRNIARELAARLRQRNRYVRPMNPRPVLFVGCSTEALDLGRAIQTALDHDPFIVRVWTDGIFDPTSFAIESLVRELHAVDFAALVLSPDDTVISRDTTNDAPRDNLIFELGLFMGSLGRGRTFLICPRGVDIKIPTDLMGITPLTYKPDLDLAPGTAVAVACNIIRKLIHKVGPR